MASMEIRETIASHATDATQTLLPATLAPLESTARTQTCSTRD